MKRKIHSIITRLGYKACPLVLCPSCTEMSLRVTDPDTAVDYYVHSTDYKRACVMAPAKVAA